MLNIFISLAMCGHGGIWQEHFPYICSDVTPCIKGKSCLLCLFNLFTYFLWIIYNTFSISKIIHYNNTTSPWSFYSSFIPINVIIIIHINCFVFLPPSYCWIQLTFLLFNKRSGSWHIPSCSKFRCQRASCPSWWPSIGINSPLLLLPVPRGCPKRRKRLK